MGKEYRVYVGGEWISTGVPFAVHNPFNGDEVATIPLAGHVQVEEAVRRAYTAFEQTKNPSSFIRSRTLQEIGNRIIRRKDEFIEIMVEEAGKTVRDARDELARAVFTFRAASDAVLNLSTAVNPADVLRSSEGVIAFSRRFPIGPVLGIASFNFPLNSLAIKVAPAIASGNPVILCPHLETPLSALLFAEIVDELEYPKGGISVLPCLQEELFWLVESDQLKMLSYSGNSEMGWRIKEASGRKKVLLQMSGLGVAVVNHDADLEFAASCCVSGAFSNAGQINTSLQQILVHEEVFYQFLGKFIKKTNQLKSGDPADPETEIGPVINEAAASRIAEWIANAVDQGADLVSGGSRVGTLIQPTVFLQATGDMLICQQEAFGPIVAITPFLDVDQAVWTVHDMEYGLQTSLFTNDLALIMRAYQRLDVGTVLVNHLPTFSVETLPHGGKKNSSFGRESIAGSMQMMTEEKLLLIRSESGLL